MSLDGRVWCWIVMENSIPSGVFLENYLTKSEKNRKKSKKFMNRYKITPPR